MCEPYVEISNIGEKVCDLIALIDTGSLVSFVASGIYQSRVKKYCKKLEPASRKLRDLGNKALELLRIARVSLRLAPLEKIDLRATFCITAHLKAILFKSKNF